jgi:hypothetical protein
LEIEGYRDITAILEDGDINELASDVEFDFDGLKGDLVS